MRAGWCSGCNAYVWLAQDGSCQNGHPAAYVSNVYDAEAPQQPAPAPQQPAYGSKEAVISAVWYALAPYTQLTVTRTQQADVEIAANVADANWGVGSKKVDFSAVMKADEAQCTVFYWEMLKEQGSGMTPGFGFEGESYSSFGGKRWGKTKEVVAVPGAGKVVDYAWDYAATRNLVEQAVRSQGWAFKVVLRKGKATY